MSRFFSLSLSVLASVICCSCQQSMEVSRGSVGVRNYSDAVVHINQVDPAYRAFFRDQDASNYSLSEQRKAYIAAAQTARTPVRASDYRPGDIRKKAVAKASTKSGSKGKTAAKTRIASKGKAAGKSTAANKKRAVAVRKPYRRR